MDRITISTANSYCIKAENKEGKLNHYENKKIIY